MITVFLNILTLTREAMAVFTVIIVFFGHTVITVFLNILTVTREAMAVFTVCSFLDTPF